MPTAVKTKRRKAAKPAARRRKRLDPEAARMVEDHLLRSAIRCSFEAFFRCLPTAKPYVYGRHTLAMLRELDRVTKRLERGLSTYLVMNLPCRHGKSDAASRRWPAWHLLRNPDHEVMLISHNDSLAARFSRSARACYSEGAQLFEDEDGRAPKIADDSGAVKNWDVAGRAGTFQASGIGGDITGRGGHVIVIDDPIRNREEAESRLMRDKVWDKFTDDVMTRRAPRCGVVIPVTRWHEDDIVGRIVRRNDPASRDYDENFPEFRVITFPAWDEKDGWLFPERFPEQYYLEQKGTMSAYAWNAEYQQSPRAREGNLLHAELAVPLDPGDFNDMVVGRGVRMCRGWDLASTKKEVTGSDPDYSVGTLAGYRDGRLFVADVVAGQWRGKTRDDIIRETAKRDGPSVKVIVESVGGYKDAFERAKDDLHGLATVEKFTPTVDKVARAGILEAVFEAKQVYVRKADWNDPWRDQLVVFPAGAHDDYVDSLVTAVHDQVIGRGRLFLSG